MVQAKIEKILELHKKWLNEAEGERADLQGADLQGADLRGAYLRDADLRGADLRGAYLQGADLRGADLRGAYLRDADLQGAYLRGADLQGADLRDADLRDADLQGADLRGADIDYSCMPLWCGNLDVHYDDKHIIQQLYHLVRNAQYSKNVSSDIKKILKTDEIIALANKFRHVDECGKIDKECK